MKRSICVFVRQLVLWSVLLFPAVTHAETYQAAFLDGFGPLTFQQDRRLRVDMETSIEMVFSNPLEQSATGPIPLIALEGQGGITLWMKRDGSGIGISADGRPPGRFAKSYLTGSGYHHIILNVRGPAARVTINGNVALNWTGFDFQAAGAEGLSLSIGGLAAENRASDASFRGWVRTVRVWNGHLSSYKWPDLRRARSFPEKSNFHNIRDIVLYSRFTDQEQAIYYTDPEIYLEMMETGAEGTTYYLPLGKRARSYVAGSFFAKAKEGRPYHSDFAFAYSVKPSVQHLDRRAVVLYPRIKRVEQIADAWLALLNKEEEGLMDFSDMLAMQTTDLPHGVEGDTNELSGNRDIFDAIAGLVGRHDGTHITELAMTVGMGVANPDPYGDTDLHESFDLTLPIGAFLEGIVVKRSDKGLVGIGIAFSEEAADLDEERLRNMLSRPLVALNNAQPGRESLNIADPDHGTFENQDVHILRRWRGIEGISLLTDTGGPAVLMQHYMPKGEGLYEPVDAGRSFKYMEKKYGVLKLRGLEKGKEDTALLIQDKAVTVYLPGEYNRNAKVVLVPPDPYPAGGADKLPWGATFALEQRATRTRANFAGYNIFELDTHDYQSSIGAFRNVFSYPDDNSKDYNSSDSKLIYPHGVFLDSDAAGNEGGRTTVVKDASEYTEHWANQLGGNIGIPLIASFSVSGSHSKRLDRAFERSVKRGIAKTHATHYGLVLDKARVRLDQDFVARIYDLRNRFVTQEQDDNLDIIEPVKAVAAEIAPYFDLYEAIMKVEKKSDHGNGFAEMRKFVEEEPLWVGAILSETGNQPKDRKLSLEDLQRAIRAVDRMVEVVPEIQFPEAGIFDQFGTHYPYAVTYGGMAFAETSDTSKSSSSGTKEDHKLKASASGVLEDIQIGVSGERDWGNATKNSYSSGTGSTFYDTYGGSMSRGGGWSLGRGEEVPLLLDLRPVHELLSPIYFHDPMIWVVLRHRLSKVLELEAVLNSPGAIREALNAGN